MFAQTPQLPLKKIAQSVLKLSDFYIEQPDSATPWREEYCQIAYRYYYLPLNFLRVQKTIERGRQVGFFEDLNHFIDWGSGPGTASFAIAKNEFIKNQVQSQLLFDHSEVVLKHFSDLHSQLINAKKSDELNLKNIQNKKNSCLMFSYSLTEENQLPYAWNDFEALMILEPSTSDDGRKLLEIRELLKAEGYSIWAPCTHQLKCPLLTHSKHDWCHDRIKVNAPDWFIELEDYLPMKNRTITTSYLLARKKPAPDHLLNLGRLTGDSLDEKGKTRQLVCRSENREFLSWMHKSMTPQVLNRGDLVNIQAAKFEIKSNELRLNQKIELIKS